MSAVNNTPLTAEQAALAAEHRKLALWVARRFKNKGIESADLEAEALLALCRAARGFDPTRGIRFTTYATPFVHGALAHLFRAANVPSRPPMFGKVELTEAHHPEFVPCDLDALEIRDLVQRLPDKPRRCVEGKFFEGKTGTQLAAEFGVSEMSVSKYLNQGLAILRAEVAVA